ncbi:MAG: hypothetical protein AB7V42_16965 [Thermoleophilia bacterium]
MIGDAAARELLDTVVVEWTGAGVLDPLRALVPTVWRKNLDRYEPTLGDDAQTLGIQSSRNICNLAVEQLKGLPAVWARDAKTLEVTHAGRTLHISKVTSRLRSWDVAAIDWSQSEVRTSSAEANSRVYVPVEGTLLEPLGPLPGQPVDPAALRHLHLAWQGFDDGGTRTWLGFPRDGDPAWFAVVLLDDDPGDRGGVRPDDTRPIPPDFDTLGEPAVELTRRDDDEQDGRARPRGA